MTFNSTLLARFAMTLAIAGLGGWLFLRLHLPLPWMLGALTAVTLCALAKLPVYVPGPVRSPMTAIIGVMMGAGFHPDLMDQIMGWLPSFVGLVAFTVAAGTACTAYLYWVARFDRVTSYFAGMPGGLVEMISIGRARGGDELTITLMHSSRILIIVMTLPFLVQLLEGTSIAAAPPIGHPIAETPLTTFVLLFFCAVVGVYAGAWLGLPAHTLLGPMLISATLHVSGLTTFVPPTEIVSVAQVALGAVLGSRFTATTPRQVLKILGLAAGMALVLISVVVICASIVSSFTQLSLASLVLAYSPGGLTEMGLVAVSIQADIAFVAAHHLFRVLLVMVCAGPVFAFLGRFGGSHKTRSGPVDGAAARIRETSDG
ncbi:MAG: AbrB family transcriptional regulator [Pseudomonadota bacterium]